MKSLALGYSPSARILRRAAGERAPPTAFSSNANPIPRCFARRANFEATSAPANAKRTPIGVLCVVKMLRKRYFLRVATRIRTQTDFMLYHFHFPIDSRRSCSFLSASSLMRACFLSCTFLIMRAINTNANVIRTLNIVTESAEEIAV